QDAVPGEAGDFARDARASLGSELQADLRAGVRRPPEPLFGAVLVFEAADFVVLRSLASATLRFSASIRSRTGASGTGSGFAISWPSSFASRIWRRSLRDWLWSSDGAKSPATLC